MGLKDSLVNKVVLTCFCGLFSLGIGCPTTANAEEYNLDFKRITAVNISSWSSSLDLVQIQGQRGEGYQPGVTDYLVEFKIAANTKEAIMKCLDLANSASVLQRVGNNVVFRVQAYGKKFKQGTTLGLTEATPRYCTLYAGQ